MKEINISNPDKTQKLMTVKEVADVFNVSPEAIKQLIRKLFPNKMQNGKTTYLDEKELACISKEMKSSYRLAQIEPTNQACRLQTTTELEVLANAANALTQLQELYVLKEAEYKAIIEEQRPKVEFYDCVTESKDTIDMGEVAKILNCGLGRNKIFEILRNKNILNKHNQPYQRYVDLGYFKIVENKYPLPDGSVKIGLKTVVFQKGLDFIRNVLSKEVSLVLPC